MTAPAKRSQLVWIMWRDAVGTSARLQVEDVATLALVVNTNIGWIIHEDETRIVLAHGTSTSGEVDYLAIPANCIVERRKV